MSPATKILSAGEPFSTFVIAICLASVVTSFLLNIHPRAPVAPKFQSCLAPSGMLPPFVKSGLFICNEDPKTRETWQLTQKNEMNMIDTKKRFLRHIKSINALWLLTPRFR